MDKRKEFLQELTALTHKYGVKIEGCGCCESPYLADVSEEEKECLYTVYDKGGYLALRTPEAAAEQEWWNKDE